MALDVLPVYESRKAALYTGMNSADFAAEIADFTVDSETAAGLTFTSGGVQRTVAPGGYIAWYQGEVTAAYQNETDFRDVFAVAGLDHTHDVVLTSGPGKPVAA